MGRPGQPRLRRSTACTAVLLERHEGLQDTPPRGETGGDQAREPPGERGAGLTLGAPRVRALADEAVQGPLNAGVRAWSAGNLHTLGQRFPVALPGGHGLAQRAVGFDQAFVALRVEPTRERLHDRTTSGLVGHHPRLGTPRLGACLFIMVQALRERLDDSLTRSRKNVFAVAALTTAACARTCRPERSARPQPPRSRETHPPIPPVTSLRDLGPLRRVGHRHPQHRVVALPAGQRETPSIPAYDQHGSRPRAVFLLPGLCRQRSREEVSTRRTPQLAQRRAHGAAHGMPVTAPRKTRRSLLSLALPTPRAALAYGQRLMTAREALGPSRGIGPQVALPWAVAATRARQTGRLGRRHRRCGRLGARIRLRCTLSRGITRRGGRFPTKPLAQTLQTQCGFLHGPHEPQRQPDHLRHPLAITPPDAAGVPPPDEGLTFFSTQGHVDRGLLHNGCLDIKRAPADDDGVRP